MRATLIRTVQHPTDWYNDLRRDMEFVYRRDDGIEEPVSEYFITDDCKAIGVRVELEYRFFSMGPAYGYHYEPVSVSRLEELKLQRLDEIPF